MIKIFEKKFKNFSDEEFNVLVIHSKAIFQALEKTNFKTPKIFKFSKNIIYYEFLEMPIRVDEMWKQNVDFDENIFKEIGKMLRSIHLFQRKKLLHGDFVLHNIFFNSEHELCLIDCHPPEVIGFEKSYLYGDGLLEMNLFLLNITGSLGLKLSIRNIKSVKLAIQNFLNGYDSKVEVKPLFYAIARFYRIRRASGFSLLNTLVHIIVGLFFIVVAYG